MLQAEKVKKPLLLIHGNDDANSGTFPMQSERLFSALKGHGCVTRLVVLPHESHGYRARESTLHVLAEQYAWLSKYCLSAGNDDAEEPAQDAVAESTPISKL